MNVKHNAFTLVEVLIALVILAIALTAIVVAVNSSLRNTGHLKNNIEIRWVASNVLSKLQVGLLQVPMQSKHLDGNSKMLKRTWYWDAARVTGINQAKNKVYQRVVIKVYATSNHVHPIWKLQGFVKLTPYNAPYLQSEN